MFAAVDADQSLSARLLRAEDARDLSRETHALLAEGLKSPDAAIRAQAVRAAGRFETPALLNDIMPRLTDQDAEVRRWAAIATANSARLFTTPAIDELRRVMGTAASADWSLYAAALGRIGLATPDQFRQIEATLAAVLPVARSRTQSMPARPAVQAAVDVVKVEGAARGLEALTRLNGKVAPLGDDATSRLSLVVESGATPGGPNVKARRLALQALRNARAIDGALARAAVRDADDEVRRIAVVAAGAPVTPELPSTMTPVDRAAVLTAGLKDAEPRVRYEAVRGWGRHEQAGTCAPIVGAVNDKSPHVVLAALDLLGEPCGAASLNAISAILLREAEALPPTGATWHRASHAIVSLAKTAPADVRTLLPRFVGHPTWQVRVYAAKAAGQTQAIEALVRLGSDAHDNVRKAALDELVRLKRPEALAVAYDGLGRQDYQLVMASARALAVETERPKATKALSIALLRLSLQGRDTSRDPRVAILTTLAEIGSTSDADAVAPFVSDWDTRVAEAAAKALTKWTGQPHEATARPRPPVAPDMAVLAKAQRLRITMARGGVLELRLLPDVAPATVARIAGLAARGYYDGLTFHRVEPTFVLQGGSPGANEFMGDGAYMRDEPGVAHERGTVGISTRGRDTGDAQMFVNLVDSPRLDHVYTVFAVVERGMDVADGVLEGDVMATVEVIDGSRR